ncbi:MAG: hypothetical protein V3U80_10365 [Flavobacteriaceae bacterium]
MKKLLFILLFMPVILFSQDDYDPLSIRIGVKPYHTGNTTMAFTSQQPIVLNVFFHYQNSIPGNLTETNFLSAIAYLNINFNKFNIFFKYRGFDTTNTIIDSMINITVTDDGTNTDPHGNTLNMREILLPYQVFQNSYSHLKSLIAHEVGHLCGLYHTFHGTDSQLEDFIISLSCGADDFEEGNFPTFSNSSRRGFTEHITRTASDDAYNATTAGDFVADTPATYRYPNLCNDTTNGISNYLESSEVKDATNTVYETIDTYNFMSYNNPHFLKHFSDGQGIRMRESLQNEEGYDNIKTTVASLYQPYKIITYPMQYFFQPGFDYEFVNCAAGCVVVSSDYDNTSFNYDENHNDNYSFDKEHTPYSDIYQSENMAVRILQIDDAQPRKCYSVNTKGISGVVVTFNDNIVNSNFYTSTLDSTAVNSSSLIQNLPSGLYIIKKNFEDGRQEQQTILKDDE